MQINSFSIKICISTKCLPRNLQLKYFVFKRRCEITLKNAWDSSLAFGGWRVKWTNCCFNGRSRRPDGFCLIKGDATFKGNYCRVKIVFHVWFLNCEVLILVWRENFWDFNRDLPQNRGVHRVCVCVEPIVKFRGQSVCLYGLVMF